MATTNASSGANEPEKSDHGYQDPPLLMATLLPPESAFEQVMIDDEADMMIAQETTPLVAIYSRTSSAPPRIPTEHDGDNDNNIDQDDSKPAAVTGPVYRDWIFAVIFYIQLVAVLSCGIFISPRGYENMEQVMNYTFIREQIQADPDNDMTPEKWQQFDTFVSEVSDYISVYPIRILLWNMIPAALFAFCWVKVTVFYVVQPFAKQVVEYSLILTVFCTVAVILTLILPSLAVGPLIIGGLLGGAVIYYVQLVWPMIPFAAVNLKVALTGINANVGTHVWAFFSIKLGLLWIVFWLYATFGILSYMDDQCSVHHDPGTRLLGDVKMTSDTNANCGQGGIVFLLLLSGYWTWKVILNTVEVTVAGVMATWCFDKEAASGCCSPAVASSLYRSVTYSFGSICLGSLLQGFMQILRKIVPDSRSRRAGNDQTCCGLCFCISECCGRVLDDVLDYFHQWAFVFVGIYGYGYVESGRKVLELFVAKGWTAIISERLASYVTGCITLTMGILTGLSCWGFTILVDHFHESESTHFVYGPVPRYVSFFLGFAFGTVTASIMMSVVRGGLNTLIVCFADSPALLEENRPELTKEMIDAWAESFPEIIHKSAFEPPTAEPVASVAAMLAY